MTLLSSDGSPDAGRGAVCWRLGEPMPEAAWADPVDAVVHLAHVWHAASGETDDPNLAGYTDARRCRTPCRRQTYLFASSISACRDARNCYGRVKWRIEQMLGCPGEVSAFIGLVNGGAAQLVWGLLRKLTTALPLLPNGRRWPVGAADPPVECRGRSRAPGDDTGFDAPHLAGGGSAGHVRPVPEGDHGARAWAPVVVDAGAGNGRSSCCGTFRCASACRSTACASGRWGLSA